MENTQQYLLTKTIPQLTCENQKVQQFSNQVDKLRDDFEDMKRAREEAKKQLEAKFQDVYRKIQNTREFQQSEAKRINDTLLAFDSKFESLIQIDRTHFQTQHDNHKAEVLERFKTNEEQLHNLDIKIDIEREERIKQSEEALRETRQQLSCIIYYFQLKNKKQKIELFIIINNEKIDRVQKEKEILRKLDDHVFFISQILDKGKTQRILQTKDLRNHIDFEIKIQRKYNEDFHIKTIDEFKHVINSIQLEMDNRFDHQNQNLDNLSKLVKIMQDTLKVIGKDS
ncbi:hypothetical protein IMG5_077940 [Ichthyophthirius multifiliis]|uniref:Uncharacterized protein n=1 Tax=Ichthyophthirius multifiliis TaxID=5932 RepID=G0QQE8_ICHMU|nr:hypothetical protein IMG5_077940 [Ichthyophthirius multifiliis]EGR32557.1 hypothetical protein IMG5_077940 [Ichthyophthirius multifiliis]|eukprot:XP_004036543.1 hypothetical protein IMG5_077940 [Ichthyophthirius multifiliis]